MGGHKEIKSVTLSPEYLYTENSTSDGTQIKYHRDDLWYKVDNSGGEGLAEYLASVVLECSSLLPEKYVRYEQVIINDEYGCVSHDCLKEGEELRSIYRLWAGVRGGDIGEFLSQMDYDDAIETVLSFMSAETGLDLRGYFANNMALAMFIRNEDLHFNNYWVIFDGTDFKEAPIMDNGRSMFVGNKKYDPGRSFSENIKNTFSKSFSGSFEQNYRYLQKFCDLRICGDRLKERLAGEEDSPQKRFLLFQLDRYHDTLVE